MGKERNGQHTEREKLRKGGKGVRNLPGFARLPTHEILIGKQRIFTNTQSGISSRQSNATENG